MTMTAWARVFGAPFEPAAGGAGLVSGAGVSVERFEIPLGRTFLKTWGLAATHESARRRAQKAATDSRRRFIGGN
jgi:hypothetical protein